MPRPRTSFHELTVGQVADRSGVAISALHFYERHGLIRSTRTANNQRRYGRDTLRRVAFIRASQYVGISLAMIRDALNQLPSERTPTHDDWARLSAVWRTELDARITHLQALRDDLTFRDHSPDHLNFAHVLDHLMSSALVVTDNRRARPTTIIDPAEINTAPNLTDGSGLAVELLRLKTGDAADRARFRAVQNVFQEITDRRLDVHQRASDSERRDLLITPVVVDVDPDTGRDVDLPLHLAGAGVEESAWLAALLTDDHDLLVLDEPASNVSAVVQRRLLRVVRDLRRNKQTIMITHSADLVPVQDPSDLAAVTRLTRQYGATTTHRPRLDQRRFDELKELLRHSQLRELLFAAGVVLVEGPTEVDAFETWLSRIDRPGHPTPEYAHVVFLSVGGDERFAKHAYLLKALGIPYAIVADGPAFASGKALSKLPDPAPDPADPTTESFSEAASRWEPYRVLTLATEFGTGERKGHGEIEAFFSSVDATLWAELNQDPGRKDKPLLGYRFANRTPVPDRIADLWGLLLHDLGLTHGPKDIAECSICQASEPREV